MTTPRHLIALACCALALAVTGCGDDEEKAASGSGAGAATTEEPAAPEATPAPEAGGDEKDLEAKPAVTQPTGEPPPGMETRDIVKGDGRTAKEGDRVTVQYVGVAYESGEQFDASWDRGEPFAFTLGAGEVIAGWDEGIAGMKVGGRRELVIPPDLAYGTEGAPPAIGPDETLIFVVDLLEVV